MTPAVMVEVLMAMVSTNRFDDAQKYEVMGRFCSALLGSSSGGVVPAHSPATLPQETPIVQGEVIIKKGAEFMCTSCKQSTLVTNQPVYKTMKTSAFREAFTPALTKENAVYSDVNGNAAVDCPSCRAKKTVWIFGKVGIPYDDMPEEGAGPLGG